jgi:hypothetical protein
LVLDVDLPNTEVDAGSSGARDLDLDDRAVFAALFFNVFLDFCGKVSGVLVLVGSV